MLLTNLSRAERNAQLRNITERPEVALYRMYLDYYRGIHFIRHSDASTDYGRNNVNRITTRSGIELYDAVTAEDKVVVKSNWCTPIIESIGDFTRGVAEPIMVSIKQDKDEFAKEEERLRQVWTENKIDTLTHELAYECGIFGKTYLRLRQEVKAGPITLTQADPTSVYEVKDPVSGKRESTINWFVIDRESARRRFPGVTIASGTMELIYAEEWDDLLVYKYLDGELVSEKNDNQEVRDMNPYGFIPFFEVPGSIYRASDIHDAISLNDELNITLTYINEIFRYAAFPMLAPKGTFGPDTPILDKKQLAEVEISPKTILPIPMERIEGKGVDTSVLEHVEKLKQDIAVVSGVPMKLLMAEVDGNTSGIALERMLGAVVKQAEVRRSYIKEAYKEVNTAILTLLGLNTEVETDVIFPEMVKVDMTDRLDEALKKQTLGISRETILDELGYDFEEEEGKRQTELENDPTSILNNELQRDNQGKPKAGAAAQKGSAR